jgi:hypothetical protein
VPLDPGELLIDRPWRTVASSFQEERQYDGTDDAHP